MKKVILKYNVGLGAQGTTLALPATAKVLHFGPQHLQLKVWIEVDIDAPVFDRHFVIIPTGGEVPSDVNPAHIQTCFDGGYVWHLYEIWK